MQNDFKENYYEEMRKQAEARRAKLQKLNMDLDSEEYTPAAPTQPTRAKLGADGQVRPRRQHPAQSSQALSQNNQPAPRAPYQQRRPQQQARPAQPQRQNVHTAQPQRQNVRTAQPQQRQQPQHQSQGAPRTPAAPPARRPAQIPQTPRGNAPRQRMQQPKRNTKFDITDGDIFNNNQREDESRAMMFALTGKPTAPAHGGNVDIQRAQRTQAPRKNQAMGMRKKKNKLTPMKCVGRTFAAIGTAVLMLIITVYAALLMVSFGPSDTICNLLVNSAMQASATKWVPRLVMSQERLDGILEKSKEVTEDVVSIDDYGDDDDPIITEDEWANAQDGMIFKTVKGSTFTAYVLLVRDPTRVFVGTSTDDFSNATAGVNIFQAADRYNALACINGGEFLDNGGHGSGYAPLGITYSLGECVFDDYSTKTFMGFTEDNKFIVCEGMTQQKANELRIRDAVSFQTGNTLIERNGDELKFYYRDGNTGTSQRTAIGQRDDGTVIMIVTDGRTASSLGATHNDMIDLMVSYGAVSAGMLDGGSSAMMYYRDYYDKYDVDKSTLDEYQLQGLVNNYKAFTNPRRIPTFFMVKPEA